MARAKKIGVTGLAMAGALFLGGSAAPELSAVSSSLHGPDTGSASNTNSNNTNGNLFFAGLTPITPHAEQVVTDSFGQIKSFWTEKYPQSLGIAATSLVILKGDAHFSCSTEANSSNTYIQASDVSGSEYCQRLGAIVITEGLASYIATTTTGGNEDALLKFFVGHEFGHAVQTADGTLEPGTSTTPTIELQADCYAGVALETIAPVQVPTMESAFQTFFPADDTRHGSPQERATSFQDGASDGQC